MVIRQRGEIESGFDYFDFKLYNGNISEGEARGLLVGSEWLHVRLLSLLFPFLCWLC